MGRKPNGRQSLNSSVVTVTNNSLVEGSPEVEYADILRRFMRPNAVINKVKLIGSKDVIDTVRQRIEILLKSDENTPDFGLLTGPSGTGKTCTVRELADEYKKDLSFFYLSASWILRKKFGNPDSGIELLFDEAIEKAPSLIFIDKIDLICTERKSQSETSRILNIILDEIENLKSTPAKVLVLAATDRPEILDSQLTKAGFFNRVITFKLPERQDRLNVFKSLLKENSNLSENQIENIADATHCYSYRDLADVYRIAKENSRDLKKPNYDNFKCALTKYKPVATKSITSPCAPLRWTDIGGVSHVKMLLQESVMWPLMHRDKFKKLGIPPKKGALLYGPPGCSKTMLAQALATESGFNFISIKGPELFSKYVGDSEAAVRRLYRNAREIAPCIIFFDEIDGLATQRAGDGQNSSVGDKVVTQLLTELNGVDSLDNVYTIAATNRPDRLDSPLLRPGRLHPAIYIPLPPRSDRKEIFDIHMRNMSLKFDLPMEIILNELSLLTEGYSGAEIAEVCHVAGTLALRENFDTEFVEFKHFKQALKEVQPTTNIEHLKAYEKFRDRSIAQFYQTNHETHEEFANPTRKNLNKLMRSLSLRKIVK